MPSCMTPFNAEGRWPRWRTFRLRGLVAVGYVGLSHAVAALNKQPVPDLTCLPTAAISKTDLTDPVWAKFNMVPAGWSVPTSR